MQHILVAIQYKEASSYNISCSLCEHWWSWWDFAAG